MIAECKSYGLPEPEFEEYSNGLAVIFRFAEPIGYFVEKDVEHALNIRQEEILDIINKYAAINIKQIGRALKNSTSQRTIQSDLNQLKNMGLINCKGKGRATVWVSAHKK